MSETPLQSRHGTHNQTSSWRLPPLKAFNGTHETSLRLAMGPIADFLVMQSGSHIEVARVHPWKAFIRKDE